MSQTRYDCLCAGIVVADHVCAPVDHLPAGGELITTDHLELTIGGCASNAAVDLAKLGTKVGVIGIVGADFFGRYVRETLQDSGVLVEHLAESQNEQTSGTLVINVKGEDRRFIHTIGTNAEFDGSAITDELIRSTRVLYLGGYCLTEKPTAEKVASLFQTAREEGVATILDVVIPSEAVSTTTTSTHESMSKYWDRIAPVLPWTDVFLPNNDEAMAITGKDNPVEQADMFRSAGAKTVVITCGREGTILISDEDRIRTGVFEVEYIDGTGSGDAFTAGYILGLLEGATTADCLHYGSALGAKSVSVTGATNGAISANELKAFLDTHSLSIESI